jgi:hypothetical protein
LLALDSDKNSSSSSFECYYKELTFEDSKTNAPTLLSRILPHTEFKDKNTRDRIVTQVTNQVLTHTRHHLDSHDVNDSTTSVKRRKIDE